MKIERKKKSGIRERQAEQTRQRLKDTLLELLKDNEFDDIAVQDITSAAGISSGLFYHYFNSKIELMHELSFVVDNYYKREDMQAVVNTGKTTVEKITLFLSYYSGYSCQIEDGHPEMLRIVRALFWHPQADMFDDVKNRFSVLKDIISEGLESGELKPGRSADEICGLLSTLSRGLVYRWYVEDYSFDLGEQLKKYVEIVLNGILA